MKLLQKIALDLSVNTRTREGTLTTTKPFKVLEIEVSVLKKLLAVVEAAKKYKELPMSDDDNRRLALALKALEEDV